VANQRTNHTETDIAQLVVARAEPYAGPFSVSGFSGQPTGNRTQEDSEEEIQS
jgi:hypothetical protein